MSKNILNNIYENNNAVKSIIDTLNDNGYEAYIVGGAVRDALLDYPINDVDITTNATPKVVEELFDKTIPTGIDYGTVTVVIEDEKIEVTTYRSDGKYSDGRRPDEVKYSTNIYEDLARRDFTINAMAFHPRFGLIDPYNGLNDIFQGIIKCVGEPAERFSEDYLRILRAIRFSMVYSFEIEEKTHEAMDLMLMTHRKEFSAIPGPRVGKELMKMLDSGNFSHYWTVYRDFLAVGIPELRAMMNYDQHNPHHSLSLWGHTTEVMKYIEHHTLVYGPKKTALAFMFAGLLHDLGKPSTQSEENGIYHFYGHENESEEIAKSIMQRLAIPRHLVDATCCIIKLHMLPVMPDRKSVLRLMNKVHENYSAIEEIFIDLVLFKLFDKSATMINIYDEYENLSLLVHLTDFPYKKIIFIYVDCMFDKVPYSIETLPINGNDLMKATGRTSGPWIGKTLNIVLKHSIEGRINNNKALMLEYAEKISHNFKE